MKKLRLFTLAFFVSLFAFSCNFNFNEKTTNVSFSIPLSAIARANQEDAKYKVECFLTGDLNIKQTIYLDETQQQAQFSFEKIPVGKNIKVKVLVYEKLPGSVYFDLQSGGSTNVKVNQDENIVNVLLKDAVTITYKKSPSSEEEKYQKVIKGEDEYLEPNTWSEENCIFAGWKIDGNSNVDYYDNAKININSDLTLVALFPFAQGVKYVEQKYIKGQYYEKCAEVVVVPQYTTAKVQIKDNSSWASYVSGNSLYEGVFTKDCNVTLEPYVIGAYEVTQRLYTVVMSVSSGTYGFSSAVQGEDSNYLPAENISWYDAIVFCNELTKETMLGEDCVYYSDEALQTVYTKDNASNYKNVYIDTTKKGYRLPTEAEWEYAARGGDPTKDAWKYAFSGVQTSLSSVTTVTGEANLGKYGWYFGNASNQTHEVGKKEANTLGLYDMSGNVSEMCYDIYPIEGNFRVYRGGNFDSNSCECCVSYSTGATADGKANWKGFRIARSL